MLTFRGVIRNGVIVLPEGASVPNGTEVDVRLRRSGRPAAAGRVRPAGGKGGRKRPLAPTLYDRLAAVVGKGQNLPRDFAAQHDHYIHGTPKRR